MSGKHCIHCNKALTRASSNRDHVPSKCLLNEPYPANLKTVRICSDCNRSFSPSEEYVAALLATLLWDDEEPPSRLGRILESNWKLQDRLDEALVVENSGPEVRVALEPDLNAVEVVVRKNAIGHLWLATGVALPPLTVFTCPLDNLPTEARENLFGQRGDWLVVQKGTYRFNVVKAYGIDLNMVFVRSVIHETIATETVFNSL